MVGEKDAYSKALKSELASAKLRIAHQESLLRMFSYDVGQVGRGEGGNMDYSWQGKGGGKTQSRAGGVGWDRQGGRRLNSDRMGKGVGRVVCDGVGRVVCDGVA